MKILMIVIMSILAFSSDYEELIKTGKENRSNYKLALENFEKARDISEEGSKEYAKACYYIAMIQSGNLEYENAVKNLVIAESILKNDDFVVLVYIRLSTIYYEYQDYLTSLKYLNKTNDYSVNEQKRNFITFQRSQIAYMMDDYHKFDSYYEKLSSTLYEFDYLILKANRLIEDQNYSESQILLNDLYKADSSNIDLLIAFTRLNILVGKTRAAEELISKIELLEDDYYRPYVYQLKGEIESSYELKIKYLGDALKLFKSRNLIDRQIDVLLTLNQMENKSTRNRSSIDSLLILKNQNLAKLYDVYFETQNMLALSKQEKLYYQKMFYSYLIGSILIMTIAGLIYYYREQIKSLTIIKLMFEDKQKQLKQSYDTEIVPDVELLQLELLNSDIKSDHVYEKLDNLITDVNNQKNIYEYIN